MSASDINCTNLQSLWKVDNPGWVKKRELEWENVQELFYSEIDETEAEAQRAYFIEGKGVHQLFGLAKIFLAPLESSDDARAIYFSDYLNRKDRIDLLIKYFTVYSKAERLPWFQTHCKYIGVGIFGKDYGVLSQEIVRKDGEVPFDEPSFLLGVFLSSIRKVLQGRREFSGYIYLTEYFTSVVPLVKRDQLKLSKEITRAFEDVDYALGSPHSSEMMRYVASKLHAEKENYANQIIDSKNIDLCYVDPKREIFGGWFVSGEGVSSLKCNSKGYRSEGEMKDWLVGIDKSSLHVDDVSDMGGEYLKTAASLIHYYEGASWLTMSKHLYMSKSPKEYYAFHLGDESDFHLFSRTPSHKYTYTKFYLDDHNDTPMEYRQSFKNAFDQWFLDLPQEFVNFYRTKEFANKIRMVVNQRSFKSV